MNASRFAWTGVLSVLACAASIAAIPQSPSAFAASHNPGTPITTAPTSIPYSGKTDAQLQAGYQQYKALKAQLLEERRQAILQASKQTDPEARLKIMATLRANQRDRWQQLQQLYAQVLPLEFQDWASARAQKSGLGK